MSKLNIFKEEWIDMVFEGRNKAYGAYELRAHDSKTTTRALIIGAVFFATVIAAPVIKNIISQQLALANEERNDKVIEAALLPPPPKDDIPPPPPEPPKSVNDQVKFPPPVVVEKEKVKDEDPPTVEELETADPGQKDVKGDKDAGDINIDVPSGDGDKGNEIIDENKVYVAVEVQASPPGGMEAFYKKFASSFTPPEVDEGVSQIRVLVGFVVEKDGSFTDIRVIRDGGYPDAGKEAIRVLKRMPNWKPAIHNGRSVRSQFALPIVVKVQ
jgi:protein TonB